MNIKWRFLYQNDRHWARFIGSYLFENVAGVCSLNQVGRLFFPNIWQNNVCSLLCNCLIFPIIYYAIVNICYALLFRYFYLTGMYRWWTWDGKTDCQCFPTVSFAFTLVASFFVTWKRFYLLWNTLCVKVIVNICLILGIFRHFVSYFYTVCTLRTGNQWWKSSI